LRSDGDSPRISIVTGVAGGIGAAAADALLARGDIVYGGDLRPTDRIPAGVHYRALDVTDETSWAALVSAVVSEHGRVDALVNAAGIIRHTGIEALPVAEWHAVTDVNQRGTWLGMRAVAPGMRLQGSGTIVNVSSGWGLTVGTANVAYQMSKGAIISLTRAAAMELAPDRIRVNVLLPGWTDSPMTQAQPADTNAAIVAAVPLGRGAVPGDHAAAVRYLTSDESAYVTGAALVVDGGAIVV